MPKMTGGGVIGSSAYFDLYMGILAPGICKIGFSGDRWPCNQGNFRNTSTNVVMTEGAACFHTSDITSMS
jgi:hypothetical protein